MNEKPLLKRYELFLQNTLSDSKKLQQEIEQNCQNIGCKRTKDNFMDCTSSCPLFYAWKTLEGIKKEIKGENVASNSIVHV